MKRSVIYLAAVFMISTLLAGCGAEKKDEEKKTAKPVVVNPVSRIDFVRTISLTGTVKPIEDSVISAEVAGNIVSKEVELGDYVEKGAVLAKIDKETYVKTYEQVEAMLKVAQASLEQNQATQKQLKDDQETNERLFEKKVISKKVLDDINTKLAEVNALVKLSEAKVKEAEIARDLARINKEKASVRCPLEKALVAEVKFDLGNYVVPGQPLVRLVNIDEVWIEVGVGEKRINEVESRIEHSRSKSEDKKATATFTIPTIGDTEYVGVIEQVSPYADPVSGTFTLRLRYPNPTHELKGGMFAQVTLPINTKPNCIVVPKSALVTEGSRNYVFVVKDGKVTKNEVEAGVTQNEQVEIIRGLLGDETIVTDGVDVLVDGDLVQVMNLAESNMSSNEISKGNRE